MPRAPFFEQPELSVRITTSGTIWGLAVGKTLRTRYIGPAPSLSSSQTVA